MATNAYEQQLQGLVCPMCLDVFKHPTILSCGHTFCMGCLEAYDEEHDLDHIVCPVCRKITELGHNRVDGLTPNFIARDMQDKLYIIASSQSFCPLHRNVHNDIFCEDCKELICLTCFIDSHKDHKIKKREELEGNLKKMRNSLFTEIEIRKAQIEEFLNNAEQHRIDIHCHFSKVEKKIKDEFVKMVTILQQNEESLLDEVDSIRKKTENQLEGFIINRRQAIDDLKSSTTILRGYTGENLDSNAIRTQYLQCSELEKSLKKSIDEETIVRLKQAAESTRFRPSDEKLLALGQIEVGVKETSNIQQMKTAVGVNRKLEQQLLQTKGKVRVTPAPERSKALNIVREVKATSKISGMAALSHDAVVVGYGWKKNGSDGFSVSGEKMQCRKREVGKVYDIAFLTDGRSVVSHHDRTIRLYSHDSTNRHSTGMIYTCKEGGYDIKLCVDQDDNIYAVNGNQEIYIFRGCNPNPHRVIPTGDIEPLCICVTKTGALITRSWDNNELDTLTVFDREGHVGSSITASDDDDEYLYATVDSQDRVLVARVRDESDVFRLTRYELRGTTLIQQVGFNELKLPYCTISFLSHCCMSSLQPKLIAFAIDQNLYFIELDG